MNTRKVVLAFLVLGMAWALLVPGITYGFNLEYEIICPPNQGTTWSGKFSDEPLKKNLNTGRITRIRGPVKRAIAKLACENVSIPDCGDGVCASDENSVDCPADCQVACDSNVHCDWASGGPWCCNGSCVDVNTDMNNCGNCGDLCQGAYCENGSCID